VTPGSRLRGVDIRDLGLPNGALVSLVVRSGQPIVPDTLTRLQTNDRIVIVCLPGTRDTVEQRLRDIDAHGRLAGWITRRTGEGP
jgi:cell volume regulation protein A